MARSTQKQQLEEAQYELLGHAIELASVNRARDGGPARTPSRCAPDLPKASSEGPGKILRLHHQADFILLLASLVAIVFGAIVAADARNTSHNLKEEERLLREHLYRPNLKPTFLRDDIATALILFGAVTALAWNVMARATLRAVSSEATKFLVRGIRQKDFSKIFEVGLPDKLWLSWRLRLWKSTVFSLFQIACYVGVGLSYRLAFRTGEVLGTINLNDTSASFLLGCDSYPDTIDVTPTYARLLGARNFFETPDATLRIAPYVLRNFSATSWVEGASWQPIVGWHSSSSQHVQSQRGFQRPGGLNATLAGPFLTGVLQRKFPPGEKGPYEIGWVKTVSKHPTCGWLPLLCRYDSEPPDVDGVVVPECFWAGLIAGNMTAKITQQSWIGSFYSSDEAYFLKHDGSEQFASDACPLEMARDFYESNTTNPHDIEIFNPGHNDVPAEGLVRWIEYNMAEWIRYFAWMISKAQCSFAEEAYGYQTRSRGNSIALARLREQRLWVPEANEDDVSDPFFRPELWCYAYSLQDETPTYTGSASFVYTTNEWVGHQTTAAILLILWGLSLLGAAYPFRSIVVKHNLNQYMAFGADVGQPGMRGASSGHAPAEDESIWRLKLEIDACGEWRFCFQKEEHGGNTLGGKEAVVETRMNKRYI